MTEDVKKSDKKAESEREFKDTQQEIMFELKIKTNEFLKKLKEQNKKSKVYFGNM